MWSKLILPGLACAVLATANLATANLVTADIGNATTYDSHPPMRPLPVASNRPLGQGPAFFVDPDDGDDANDGSEQTPWRTLRATVPRLTPGDTLYLRGGIHYGGFKVDHAFSDPTPITIRSYPGELAIIDAGIRMFYEDPASAWEPAPGGHPDEYRSTEIYNSPATHNLSFSRHMLSGNFGDSLVPLFRYKILEDLQSDNQLWRDSLSDHGADPVGIYAGPGLRYDAATGRIHVRLSHTNIAALADDNYRGVTDPRLVRLIIPSREIAVKFKSAKHIRLQDVVIRGGDRTAIKIEGGEDITIEGVTAYSGLFGVIVGEDAQNPGEPREIRILRSAIRGYSAPWHSRKHHKDRAWAGALVKLRGHGIVVAASEMTDHHDGLFIANLENGEIYGNLLDNFNDDGIEVGGLRESGIRHIHGNLFSRCVHCLTTHKGTALASVGPDSGNYVFRNVFDLRRGTYSRPPRVDELPLGADYGGMDTEPKIVSDHGRRVWAAYYVYHNTFLRRTHVSNRPYGFEWGTQTESTIRRVHNNIFVNGQGPVGLVLPDPTHDFKASHNLFWSLEQKAPQTGGSVGDVRADPQLVVLSADPDRTLDFALGPRSLAIDAGVELPAKWPDPMRNADRGAPDIGALPYGVEWTVPGLGGGN